MYQDYTKAECRVNEVAKKINPFCSALYEYFIRLRSDKRHLAEKIKAKEAELEVLMKEMEQCVNNQAETKAILLEHYKLDIDALETEEQL